MSFLTEKGRWYESAWFLGLIFALALVALNWESFLIYWQSPFIQGWDGSGHAAIGEYYANHIFPKTWGWVPNWYAGIPFPQFYPPLIYFLVAAFSFILPFSYLTVFKICITLLQLVVPFVLVFFVARRSESVWPRLVSGVFAVLLVSAYQSELSESGIALFSTLRIGLVSQLLAFVFLVPWYHYFLQIENSIKARYLAGVFLFLVFLSNAHTAIVVLYLFCVVFCASLHRVFRRTRSERRMRLRQIRDIALVYFLSGLVPLAAAAFWVLPLLSYYAYFVTDIVFKTPPIYWGGWLDIFVVIVICVLGCVVGFKRRRFELALISLSPLLFFALMQPLSLLDSIGIPVHANRWIGVMIFIAPLVLGLLWIEVSKSLKTFSHRLAVFLLACVFIFFSTGFHGTPGSGGLYLRYAQDQFFDVLEYLASWDKRGLLVVEAVGYDNISSFAMDAYLGLYSPPVTTSIFRESSISSYALTPIRNMFSVDPEVWGFKSFLAEDYGFIQKPLRDSLDLARHIGAGSFLIRSGRLKTNFLLDSEIEQIHDFGSWTLFALRETPARAEILAQPPVIFIGKRKFKARSIDDYDWVRFSEELLFQGSTKNVMYYPREQRLDAISQMPPSKGLIVSTYRYHDFSRALGDLIGYSRNKPLILVADKDPLFKEIFRIAQTESSFLKDHSIVFVDRLKKGIIETNQLRLQMPAIVNALRDDATSEEPSIPVEVIFKDKEIRVMLPPQTAAVPVYIKGSYFPTWQREDGEAVFLASPGFILTFATSSFNLRFSTPGSVYIGVFISLIAVAGVSLRYFRYKRPGSF